MTSLAFYLVCSNNVGVVKIFYFSTPVLDLPLGTILNPPLLKFAKLASIHIVIPYQIVKFRSINILAMVTLGPTLTPANISSYRTSKNLALLII